MAVSNYGLLKGQVINSLPFAAAGDHYQIEVKAGGQLYRVAVDVYSQLTGAKLRYSPDGKTTLGTDRMVMYYKDENYTHPVTAALQQITIGFTPKAKLPAALCLDYLRTQPALFPVDKMQVVPPSGGKGASLDNDIDDPWVQKALNNADAEIYVFGSSWDDNAPGSHPDPHQYFHPNPTLGVHDIHMNQGDTGTEAKYNGTYQDGALLFHFITAKQWVAMFFRFQNQSIHTDNQGNPAKTSKS